MDDVARFNKERWEELAAANCVYCRPWLDLDARGARTRIDPAGMLGEVEGKDVLCLASGGGQQSAAFALLGAKVTVLDICEGQLARDREGAAYYGVEVKTVQGDMRDLSHFADASFDIVWHAHSLGFVPDARAVFREVARVLRPGGIYHMGCHNPFTHGLYEGDYSGDGYVLRQPYVDGVGVHFADPYWDIDDQGDEGLRVLGPKEFRHGLGAMVDAFTELGFVIRRVSELEAGPGDANAQPGSWEHYKAIAPPYLALWMVCEGDSSRKDRGHKPVDDRFGTRPTLTTDRLILRPFALEDAPDVQRLAGDRDIASTTLNIPHPYEDGVAEKWIGGHADKFRAGELVNFAITLRETRRLIGAVGLTLSLPNERAELGYWIGKPWWGRGLCTEAAAAVLRYGFNELGLNRIHASHLGRNPASGRVMEKIGMRCEGRRRRHVKKWDVLEDLEVRAILCGEFDKCSGNQ